MGVVDTDGDGQFDRGGAMFFVSTECYLGTEYSPLSIGLDDETVNIDDQVFSPSKAFCFKCAGSQPAV